MNNLPDGYMARPVRMDDLEAALDTMNAYSKSMIGAAEDSVESLKLYWQSPGFELEKDTIAIFTPQGQIAGYSEFWDNGAPHVRLVGWSVIHPDFREQGLGQHLLEWSIERGKQNLEKAPEGTRVVLQHYVISTNREAARLFTENGFQHVRSNYTMRIEFDIPPQPLVLPDGITIRSVQGDEEIREAMYTAHQAFKDHWGNTNTPFEEYYQHFKHRIDHDPHFDPSLWFVALDSNGAGANGAGPFAGVSLCYKHMDEDPDLGWVGTLGVLRPWRRHGVGLALLQHSFCELYRRGKQRAGLGVDASSLTGAVRLYERAGMHVLRQYDAYELELRPGVDIVKRTIEEPVMIEEK